jgi:hypothetical protein
LRKRKTSLKFEKKELLQIKEPDYFISNDSLKFLIDTKKPWKFKLNKVQQFSIFNIFKYSYIIPSNLPHISFEKNQIEYCEINEYPYLKHDVYRYKQSTNRSAFMVSTDDLKLHLYNSEFIEKYSLDVSNIVKDKYSLRCLEISSDFSKFFFTDTDKAYILSKDFQVINCWEVPHKEGWVKRKYNPNVSLGQEEKIKKYLDFLEVNEIATFEDIKNSYRRLAIRYHPDLNPNDPRAEKKMKFLNETYEFLTGESYAEVLNELMSDDEYWVNQQSNFKFDVMGMKIGISFNLGGEGRDWIYGVGISDDGSTIYLGCYSGKVYKIIEDGIVERVYDIPTNNESGTNPIRYVVEREDYLHILSNYYLYILKNDKCIFYLNLDSYTNIKWYEDGFLQFKDKDISIYSNDGGLISQITSKNKIYNICYRNGLILVETARKSFLFSLVCS